MDELGALVDESSVELDELGSGITFCEGIFCGENATCTDDRDRVAKSGVERGDDLRGMLSEGSARETAYFLGIRVTFYCVAGDRGVGGDEEVEPTIAEDAAES